MLSKFPCVFLSDSMVRLKFCIGGKLNQIIKISPINFNLYVFYKSIYSINSSA